MDLYIYVYIYIYIKMDFFFFSPTCSPFVVSSAVAKQGSASKSPTVRDMEQNGRHQQQQPKKKKEKRVTTGL